SQFTKAFTVGPGPALMLPVIGAIPLAGVRRAQVETYLTQQLKRYMKDPVVHAKVLVRLSILGEVEHPGFYPVRADAPVSDALMAAGGPTKDAKFTGTHIDRIGRDGVAGSDLQEAIARGATVDGMGLRSGDQIIVPRRHDSEATFRIIGILAGIPAVHVEAGLRSGDSKSAEEINDVLSDRRSEVLVGPSRDAADDVASEGGAAGRIQFVGNGMIDTLSWALPQVLSLDAATRYGV